MRNPSRIFSAVAALGFMASLSACQVKPGEYRIYKITSLPVQEGADCGTNPDLRDSTTFFTAGTLQIFATDADDFFLEYGEDVLIGSRSGTDYTFEGDDVQVDDPGENTTTTTTRSLDVAISIKGYKITGDFVLFTSQSCGGDCDGFPSYQCTVTGSFFGAEIKDVELERGV
ncbi:hypothetical protein OV203_42525 [Nannocystis sp. ILAH1]|uniref:hypothetical protein n=1 Tax=unclassified Nannocystis TaxID=2627009 RepID=UPI00226FA6AD|nr:MULTISPECIES: hypothetical protein [unclassified Nannocystis]MCY0993891.1 hypothetical protein [Nannocystis sp. ILAH1]MCY1065745.1 hypothetical protein [Nannocystis sp. RBIL2]